MDQPTIQYTFNNCPHHKKVLENTIIKYKVVLNALH